MNRIVKINSQQGGSFTASNNLIDFKIPDDGVYDLSKSYINIISNVVQIGTDDANNGGAGVYCPKITLNNDDGAEQQDNFNNVALIKNCSMRNQNVGLIEDIRRCDILRTNLYEYEKTFEEKMSDQRKNLVQTFSTSRNKNSIHRELHKEGSAESRNTEGAIRIHLKELMNFGNVSAYDSQKYGKTDLHLECNFDKVRVAQYLGSTSADWTQGGRNANGGFNMSGALALTADRRHIILGSGATASKYNRLEDILYWVGQKVIIKFDWTQGNGAKGARFAGANNNTATRRIAEIYYNRGDNKADFTGVPVGGVCLRLSAPLDTGVDTALGTTELITSITITGDPTTSNVISFDYAELVLEKIMNPPKIQYPIQYSTFSTEEQNAEGQTQYSRQLTLEPSCINFFGFQPSDIKSKLGSIINYRLRLNNEDLTNQDINTVVIGDKNQQDNIYYDRLNMTFGNAGIKLKNLLEVDRVVNVDTGGYSDQLVTDKVILCNPIPMSNQNQLLQVNVRAEGGNIGKLCFFKQLVKQI